MHHHLFHGPVVEGVGQGKEGDRPAANGVDSPAHLGCGPAGVIRKVAPPPGIEPASDQHESDSDRPDLLIWDKQ